MREVIRLSQGNPVHDDRVVGIRGGGVGAGGVRGGAVGAVGVEAGRGRAGVVGAVGVEAGRGRAGGVEAGRGRAGGVGAVGVEAGRGRAGGVQAGRGRAGGVGAGRGRAGVVGVGVVGAVAVGAGGRGVDVVRQVRNICDRSKWPYPKIQFEEEESFDGKPVHRGWLRLGNVGISNYGRTKVDVKTALYSKLYVLLQEGLVVNFFNCWWDCCGGSECLNGSPSKHPLLQAHPRHRFTEPGGKKCNEKKHEKFMGKIGNKFYWECPNPDCHHKNFVRYSSCLKCATSFVEVEEEWCVIFFDVERAHGSGKSDAINIGAVKYSYRDEKIVDRFNSYVWTEGQICQFGTKHKHHIKKMRGRMYKNNVLVSHDLPKTALEKFDEFLRGSKFAVCHDSVDYQTISSMIFRNAVYAPTYDAIPKRDSQVFFQFIMRSEFETNKFNLPLLVKTFGDERGRQMYNDDAHGALTDAVALCNVSTGYLSQRFKDWLLLSTGAEDQSSGAVGLQLRRPTLEYLPA